MALQRDSTKPDQWHVLTKVQNYGRSVSALQVTFSVNGQRLRERSLALGPHELTAVREDLVVSGSGLLEAEISPPDWLVADDHARLADERLKAEYERAHRDYLARRDDAASRSGVEPLPPGTQSAGGMPDRVKCLHALVAHELAAPGTNPLGREALAAAGRWWSRGPCVTVAAGEEE